MSAVTDLLAVASVSKLAADVYTSAQNTPFSGQVVELEPDFVTIQGCTKLSVVLLSHVIAASIVGGENI